MGYKLEVRCMYALGHQTLFINVQYALAKLK